MQGVRSYTILQRMVSKDPFYLGRLQDYYALHRLIPSYAEIAALVGVSKQGAVKFVDRMIFAGYISKGPGGRLSPANMFFARPHVGKAPAGFASPATEALGDAITIDEYLVEHPSKTVLVEVRGESMIEAGIHDGDFLIVERNTNPSLGKVVVAIVDGDFTIKYLRSGKDGMYLEPANADYPNIYPEESLDIYGEVVGQFRKF
ncbi:repressor LexA [Mariprofundus ferrinatatus]|uniref:Repressor LexA n=2 Tax=Mariprofundus ferrinatatus TaxID=1921087 RepID=A0A2K8L4V5_9PROT|nr:repressor LexA [Mariprofundus ferrinatatus]